MMKCGSSGSLKVGAVCVNSGTVGVVLPMSLMMKVVMIMMMP